MAGSRCPKPSLNFKRPSPISLSFSKLSFKFPKLNDGRQLLKANYNLKSTFCFCINAFGPDIIMYSIDLVLYATVVCNELYNVRELDLK